jgi:hypothetical protein
LSDHAKAAEQENCSAAFLFALTSRIRQVNDP